MNPLKDQFPQYSIRPEFIRLPKPGQTCPFTGLSRSTLKRLILPTKANNSKPPVDSVVIKDSGDKAALRLIVYDSLIRYIYSFNPSLIRLGTIRDTPEQSIPETPQKPSNPPSKSFIGQDGLEYESPF